MSWYNIGAAALSIVAQESKPKGGPSMGSSGGGSGPNMSGDVFKNIIPMLANQQGGGVDQMAQAPRSVEQGPFTGSPTNPGQAPQSFSGMK